MFFCWFNLSVFDLQSIAKNGYLPNLHIIVSWKWRNFTMKKDMIARWSYQCYKKLEIILLPNKKYFIFFFKFIIKGFFLLKKFNYKKRQKNSLFHILLTYSVLEKSVQKKNRYVLHFLTGFVIGNFWAHSSKPQNL